MMVTTARLHQERPLTILKEHLRAKPLAKVVQCTDCGPMVRVNLAGVLAPRSFRVLEGQTLLLQENPEGVELITGTCHHGNKILAFQ